MIYTRTIESSETAVCPLKIRDLMKNFDVIRFDIGDAFHEIPPGNDHMFLFWDTFFPHDHVGFKSPIAPKLLSDDGCSGG